MVCTEDVCCDERDHGYQKAGAHEMVVYYLAGYVHKKITKTITCEECCALLTASPDQFNSVETQLNQRRLTELRSFKPGCLREASFRLYALIKEVEEVQEQGQETASHPCASGATATAVSTVEIADALLQLSQCMKDVPDIMCTQVKGIQVDVDSIVGKQFRLLPGDKEVQHFHFEALLDYEEQQAGLRAVPKLTKAHIRPNDFQKLSVKLAVQASLL
ncbi:hypothetical protein MRX96_028959 [Rhipicephalus microplus]